MGIWSPGPWCLGSSFDRLYHSFFLGVAYTSECFPCKPGTYAAKQGSPFCKLCPANYYSNKGETSCHPCDADKYSGDVSEGRVWGSSGVHTKETRRPILLAVPKMIILCCCCCCLVLAVLSVCMWQRFRGWLLFWCLCVL